jgi:PAS domain S-box-containing protein
MNQWWNSSLFFDSADGLIAFDSSQVILAGNAASQTLLGYSHTEIEGSRLALLYIPGSTRLAQSVARAIEAGVGSHVSTDLVTKGGVTVSVSIAVSPIKDPKGDTCGGVLSLRDAEIEARILDESTRKQEELEVALRRATGGFSTLPVRSGSPGTEAK